MRWHRIFSAASLPHLFTESQEEPYKRVKPSGDRVAIERWLVFDA